MLEIGRVAHGWGVIAVVPLARGTVLFGADDWADEQERASYVELSPEQVEQLPADERAVFLRFAYNHERWLIRGTFHPELTRHLSNFLNHSCDPNAWYDGEDQIVTRRDVAAGEEVTLDYGTYSFSFDHEMTCCCGTARCRGRVQRDDWKTLARVYGYAFPRFMHEEIRELLEGTKSSR